MRPLKYSIKLTLGGWMAPWMAPFSQAIDAAKSCGSSRRASEALAAQTQ